MFGKNLKNARIKNNIKQSELGQILGVAGNTISNWEKGVSRPDLDTLVKISSILNVSPNAFLDIDDEKTLSFEETELLNSYSRLNLTGREKLNEYLHDILSIDRYLKSDNEPEIEIQRSRVRK